MQHHLPEDIVQRILQHRFGRMHSLLNTAFALWTTELAHVMTHADQLSLVLGPNKLMLTKLLAPGNLFYSVRKRLQKPGEYQLLATLYNNEIGVYVHYYSPAYQQCGTVIFFLYNGEGQLVRRNPHNGINK